jgi:hypothetical protein
MVTEEEFSYRLISTDITNFSLHPKYGTDEELTPGNGDFRFGINWKIVERDETSCFIDMYAEVRLLRKEDRFQIVLLEVTGHYEVSKDISFNTKLVAINELYNNLAAQVQGIWHIKIVNPNIAAIIPQAYNKMIEDEEAFKKQVYETWE